MKREEDNTVKHGENVQLQVENDETRTGSLAPEGNKRHKCRTCGKTYATPSILRDHIYSHLNQRSFKCGICNKTFNTKRCLHKHQLHAHVGKRNHSCNFCGKTFVQQSGIYNHLKLHIGKKEFKCQLCNKQFIHKYNLNRHLLIHSGQKGHSCHICQMKFCYLSNLKRHYTMHTKEKQYKCCVCLDRCSLSFNLKTHLKIHVQNPPFICVCCKETFDGREDLINHLYNKHCKERFTCKLCKNVFFTSNQKLLYHNKLCHGHGINETNGTELTEQQQANESMVILEDDDEFSLGRLVCCGLEFDSVSKFKTHIKYHFRDISDEDSNRKVQNLEQEIDHSHVKLEIEEPASPNEPSQINANYGQTSECEDLQHEVKLENIPLKREYSTNVCKCILCNGLFNDTKDLKSHYKNVHIGGKIYCCSKCGDRFSKIKNLESHLESHKKVSPYSCNICLCQYDKLDDLKRDFSSHQGSQYSCFACETSFHKVKKLIKHVKQNTCCSNGITKKLCCTICCKRFDTDETERLKTHVLGHFGSTPFFCNICKTSFPSCGELEDHTNEEHSIPYACALCKVKCLESKDLKFHVKKMHIGMKPYGCSKCNVRVSSITLLEAHFKEHEL